jgi:sensor histidine kinase YesM
VENCIKHVIAMRQEGGAIQVRGSVHEDHTVLEVSDDGPGFDLASISPDHGLANLVARMDLLYGGAGYLEVTQIDGRNAVRLHVPAPPQR